MATLPQPQIITDMYEAASRARGTKGRSYLGMSGIGGRCERALWYAFRGYTPSALEGRAQMIFNLGDLVEQEVLKWLRAAGYRIAEQQREFVALNGYFRGHCDGVIEGVTKRPHILEIKSASSGRFKMFQKDGIRAVSEEYWAQVQCYMGYGGLDRAVWVVMNKDTCELYSERAHFAKSEFKALEEKAARIINAKDKPPRGYPEGARECGRCGYAGHCASEDPYVQTTQTCGSCWYCEPENGHMFCRFPAHPNEITRWGECCLDWKFRQDIDRVPF